MSNIFDKGASADKLHEAIENAFNVKVESVNTVNVKPKKKRVGRYVGKTNKVKNKSSKKSALYLAPKL